jgi:hypothetical protein
MAVLVCWTLLQTAARAVGGFLLCALSIVAGQRMPNHKGSKTLKLSTQHNSTRDILCQYICRSPTARAPCELLQRAHSKVVPVRHVRCSPARQPLYPGVSGDPGIWRVCVFGIDAGCWDMQIPCFAALQERLLCRSPADCAGQ